MARRERLPSAQVYADCKGGYGDGFSPRDAVVGVHVCLFGNFEITIQMHLVFDLLVSSDLTRD
jgi:hypothetical protein